MRRQLLLLFSSLLLLGINSLCAQTTAVLSLQALDQATEQPLLGATARLYTQADSQLVAGIITGEAGRASLRGVAPGNYLLALSYLGHETRWTSVLVGKLSPYYDLGKILLVPRESQVETVQIEGEASTVAGSMDRKTFDLDDQAAQAGGSVLDAMRGLPGITVDGEGKIFLRGSDQVAILIDGKQSSLTGFGNQKGLDNIPAGNVARIEIINNPSAKYDASGMAGVINIIYKEEQETGLNGELGFTYGLGELTQRKADLPSELGHFSLNPKYLPSLRLNYNRAKLRANLRGEVLRQRKLPNNEFNTRSYDDGRVIASQVPENRTQTQYILNGGLDWLIDPRNTLTVTALLDYESHLDTAQVPYIELTRDIRNRYWRWSEQEVTGFANLLTQYKHQFRQPGHVLEVSGQYTRGWEDEQYFLTDSSAIRQGQDTTHIIAIEQTGVFLLNYTKPLRSGRLEAGSKVQLRRIPVTYEIGQGEASIIYPELGTFSNWGEDLYAAYLNYVWERPRYEVEAGLRAEQAFVFYSLDPVNAYYADNDAYDYFELYPNVRLTLKLNPQNGLSLFYNRRVDRPGEPELRVFPKYDDPELLKVGNPYLRPQFTQTFELAYRFSWTSGSLFLAGYYRLIDQPFTRVFAIDSTSSPYDIVNRIYQNVGSGRQAGIEVLATQQIAPWWKVSASFNLYANTIDAYTGTLLFPYQRPFSIDRTVSNTWDVKVNQELRLAEAWQLQLTTLYYAPLNIPQGRQLSRASVDLGLKRRWFQQRLEVTLSGTDLFNTFGLRQEIVGEGFTNRYENYYETQVIRLGAKWKF
jgi:outer membrane receptor protein involved in Fe transport